MSELTRHGGSVLVPKASLPIAQSQLVVIDPTSEAFVNVTSSCFAVGDVWRFFARFERSLTETEERVFEEAKVGGLIGKFRDFEARFTERVEREHGKKSAWLLSLLNS